MSDMKTVRLAEVLSIEKGKKIMPSATPTAIRYIQIEDLRGEANMKWAEEEQQVVACDEHDVLLAWDGANAGEFGYGLKGAVGSTLAKLSPLNGSTHTPYLGHFLKSKTPYLRSKCTGATIPHVNRRVLEDIEIPLPPLPMQRRIAAVLDKAQALVANDRQTLALYDQLAKSLFLELFGDPVKNERGWEVVKLEDICGVASSRRVFVEELVDSGIPFYRGTEIGMLGEGIEVDPSLFITEEHYARLQEHSGIPKPGDLLLPSICPDGRIYIVPDHSPFYFKDGRVLWVQVDDSKVSSAFLRSTLQSLFSVNYSKIASGTTFAELKIVALKKLMLPLPPVKSQQGFEVAINKVNGQRTRAEKSLRQSEGLFGSLLQSAFAGGLGI